MERSSSKPGSKEDENLSCPSLTVSLYCFSSQVKTLLENDEDVGLHQKLVSFDEGDFLVCYLLERVL
ncbi:MAG: hypothetical protein WC423_26505 [Vulcanimicrobiota bacterium]